MKTNALINAFAITVAFSWAPTFTRAAAVGTVALSGQQAPGVASGITFGNLSVGALLNDAGQTAFRSTLSGAGVDATNDGAILSEGSGNLNLMAREGDQTPGMPSGVLYGSLDQVLLNDSGQVAIRATLIGSGVNFGNDQSVWSDRTGSLTLVSREGSQAPGTPDGVRFGRIDSSSFIALNNAGQTGFSIHFLTGTGVDSTNNSGIWSENSDTLALVARAGDHAPSTSNGVNFSFFSPDNMNFNDAGQTAFQAGLAGTGVNSTNNSGIWSEGSGSLALVARTGSPAPGTPSGVNFISFTASTELNNSGKIAFAAGLVGTGVVSGTNSQGIWSDASGSLSLVVRAGDHAPGTPSGVNFGTDFNYWDPVLNDAGQIAFIDYLRDGSGSLIGNGIWSGSSGSLALVARDGDHAPGAAPGTNFAFFENSHVLNSAGQVALFARLTNNKEGLWATDRDGVLQYIMCEGDLLEVAPGDFRTIQDFGFFGETGNGDGRRSGFNNLGQVAFSASFTDGTSGIFVSNAVALLPGDINLDSNVNAADISALMAALSDLPGYQTKYHLDDQLVKSIADINQDNKVTNADLQALLDKLKTGSGSTDPIPEPSALVLFALTAMGFAAHRKKLRLAQRIP